MRIRVDDIHEKGLILEFKEDVRAFPILAEMIKKEECKFLSPIKIHLSVKSFHKLVESEGNFEFKISIPCCRCLKESEIILSLPFKLNFTSELSEVDSELSEDDLELNASKMDIIPFNGKEIDFKDAIQEEILMSFPIQPLCSETCVGLCHKCGANLNEENCNCEKKFFNPQFAALKNFKIKD